MQYMTTNHSHGTLHDLLHLGLQKGMVRARKWRYIFTMNLGCFLPLSFCLSIIRLVEFLKVSCISHLQSTQWKESARPTGMDMVLWERACFFLTPTSVISIFRTSEASSSITKEASHTIFIYLLYKLKKNLLGNASPRFVIYLKCPRLT